MKPLYTCNIKKEEITEVFANEADTIISIPSTKPIFFIS